MSSLGERIRYFREAKKLTQEQLAQLIGVAKTTITGYEKGNREPDVYKIKKLASALNVTGDALLGITGYGHDTNTDVTCTEMKHIEKYRSLDDHGKKAVDVTLALEAERTKAQSAAAAFIYDESGYVILPGREGFVHEKSADYTVNKASTKGELSTSTTTAVSTDDSRSEIA